MKNCIFCKIANGEIESKIIYSDETIVVFSDISPKAPVHVLIIPKEHIDSMNDLTEVNLHCINSVMSKVPYLAKLLGIDQTGYRIVVNCGKDGGQSVEHLHFHLLGGRALDWPPG